MMRTREEKLRQKQILQEKLRQEKAASAKERTSPRTHKSESLPEGDPPCNTAIPSDLVFTPEEIQKLLKIGRSQTYELLNTGTIASMRIGRKIYITRWTLLQFLGAPE